MDADMQSHLNGINISAFKKDMHFTGDFLHYETDVSKRLLAFQSASRWGLDAMKQLIQAVKDGNGEKEDLAKDLNTILTMFEETFNYTDEKIALLYCNSVLKLRDAVLQKTTTTLTDDFVRALRASDFASKPLFCFKDKDVDKDKKQKIEDAYGLVMDAFVKNKAGEIKPQPQPQTTQKVDYNDKPKFGESKRGRGGRGGYRGGYRGRGRGSAQYDSKDSNYDKGSNKDYQESRQVSSNKDQVDKSQENYHKKGGNK